MPKSNKSEPDPKIEGSLDEGQATILPGNVRPEPNTGLKEAVGDEPRRAALKDVIAEVVKEGAEFFVNTKCEPVIFLPDTPFQPFWPAGHERVQSYLAAIYHDLSDGGYMKSSELTALVCLLKDSCYKGGRRLTDIEAPETERDPIVQGILCLVNSIESFEGMTANLLAKIRERDILKKIHLYNELPVLTNIFSRRLKRLIPSLRGLGVDVELWHEEDGSHCRLKRLPTFIKETDALLRLPSAESSGATPRKGKDYVHTDGTDGIERFDEPTAGPKAKSPESPNTDEGEMRDAGEQGGAK